MKTTTKDSHPGIFTTDFGDVKWLEKVQPQHVGQLLLTLVWDVPNVKFMDRPYVATF